MFLFAFVIKADLLLLLLLLFLLLVLLLLLLLFLLLLLHAFIFSVYKSRRMRSLSFPFVYADRTSWSTTSDWINPGRRLHERRTNSGRRIKCRLPASSSRRISGVTVPRAVVRRRTEIGVILVRSTRIWQRTPSSAPLDFSASSEQHGDAV